MNKKLLIVSVALVLVACFAVGMTIAYLQDNTSPVVNTFTIGKVDIELNETADDFQMVPGRVIDKDPKVTVVAGSEDCYVFVKIEEGNDLDDYITYTVASGWTELTAGSGIYWRLCEDITANQVYSVLDGDSVTVLSSVTNAMMDDAATAAPTLTFTAYAIQAETFNSASAAWTASGFGA